MQETTCGSWCGLIRPAPNFSDIGSLVVPQPQAQTWRNTFCALLSILPTRASIRKLDGEIPSGRKQDDPDQLLLGHAADENNFIMSVHEVV